MMEAGRLVYFTPAELVELRKLDTFREESRVEIDRRISGSRWPSVDSPRWTSNTA